MICDSFRDTVSTHTHTHSGRKYILSVPGISRDHPFCRIFLSLSSSLSNLASFAASHLAVGKFQFSTLFIFHTSEMHGCIFASPFALVSYFIYLCQMLFYYSTYSHTALSCLPPLLLFILELFYEVSDNRPPSLPLLSPALWSTLQNSPLFFASPPSHFSFSSFAPLYRFILFECKLSSLFNIFRTLFI